MLPIVSMTVPIGALTPEQAMIAQEEAEIAKVVRRDERVIRLTVHSHPGHPFIKPIMVLTIMVGTNCIVQTFIFTKSLISPSFRRKPARVSRQTGVFSSLMPQPIP
ncbi:MAG: hypothetical protein AVDCRST_MAG56-1490 [uncultured Cytophagales bacterium]|uniref:Uncharacterized protein n=1 Tax=uncultured Cytophagales bacterium TaxID=158755 RepID=A0A6J4I4E7_9SPHI|nr:MAG: hypothetical protein AVDCRST_MAG56-1490 [uncultured Cytophagales bacterium]